MLGGGPLGEGHQHLLAVAHVEALLGDDAPQDALVRPVGAVLEHGLLGDERRRIDQVGDRHLIGPGDRLVVEDVVEPGAPGEQVVEHLGPGLHPRSAATM